MQNDRELPRDGDLGLAEAVSLGELGSPSLQPRPFRHAGQQHADFVEDTLRITRRFRDPANHAEVAAIASRLTKQPPERFDWPFTAKDYYHAPDMKPNLDALQKNVAMMKDLGFVRSEIDVKSFSDLSLIDAAAKRLE